MYILSSDHRLDEHSGVPPGNDTLMVGTSAGIRGVHDARALPFDTITYLLRADAARAHMGRASGLFFAFDKRLNGDTADQQAIDARTERLRQVLDVLLPHFAMTTHTELESRGLDRTIEGVRPCTTIEPGELREYTRVQTAQVLHMRRESCNGSGTRFVKFGWILSRRANGAPVGGEVNFDQLLPEDSAVERVYTAPAFPLDSTNGKAPYLLNASDRPVRVCLPERGDDVGAEVLKVQSGISRVMHDTLRVTAETVLGRRTRIHASDDELVTLPLGKAMRQRVTDERALADLRELLSASLLKLLP